MTPLTIPGIKPAVQRAWESFCAQRAYVSFRRRDLAEVIQALPRLRYTSNTAAEIADHIIRHARKADLLEKTGSVYWQFRSPKAIATRTLAGGAKVPELPTPVKLTVESRCPRKWVLVDLETGSVYGATETGNWVTPDTVQDEALTELFDRRNA
ncbi:hypothetical protein KTD31_01870 [Burkholderia multivorans]|jgi:hypothetical protein|uniref:hypothetical protein n=1 Tax=Burkholderia multivorans TaxID=87883 RepID=UPI001C240C17|nr:hypothetical protein [Burkholderia multivorans]MBU9200151.1 hypothetical protein [Burkholderia multivorans]MDN8078728.1 hypothetical protein [Burkholderia multivorans]